MTRHQRHGKAAFTLVELMVAVGILSILMVFVGTILTAASRATLLSHMRMDADRQARLVFDGMSDDFTRMLRRNDVDFHFVKQSGNDCFFFFCENPGYFGSTVTSTMQSNAALVGYRINTISNPPTDTPNTLEKLAEGLSWDLQTPTYPPVYLTFDQAGSFAPDSGSTIIGRWPNIDQSTFTDSNFHVLGDSTFRLEFCFLLSDGTYSVVPALNYTTGGVTSKLNATLAPTSSNGATTYGVGSRWYDTTNSRGYICTAAPASGTNAVWQPLGMRDVQAVVVAIAILDQSSQKMISTNSAALATIAAALADPTATDLSSTPPKLMATTWMNKVNGAGFAASVSLPNTAAAQVRIYQRYFYLNNLISK